MENNYIVISTLGDVWTYFEKTGWKGYDKIRFGTDEYDFEFAYKWIRKLGDHPLAKGRDMLTGNVVFTVFQFQVALYETYQEALNESKNVK